MNGARQLTQGEPKSLSFKTLVQSVSVELGRRQEPVKPQLPRVIGTGDGLSPRPLVVAGRVRCGRSHSYGSTRPLLFTKSFYRCHYVTLCKIQQYQTNLHVFFLELNRILVWCTV